MKIILVGLSVTDQNRLIKRLEELDYSICNENDQLEFLSSHFTDFIESEKVKNSSFFWDEVNEKLVEKDYDVITGLFVSINWHEIFKRNDQVKIILTKASDSDQFAEKWVSQS